MKYLSIFTPSHSKPEDLEFVLVQRQAVLRDAVERVKESAVTAKKHHLLFLGPPGSGKTHLVTLLVHRLGQDSSLSGRMRIAWLPEDETSTTLLEFLIKVCTALELRHPGEFPASQWEAAYDMKPEEALAFVSKQLSRALGHHTLLIVLENIDAIFDGLGNGGQKQLRSFFQEHPKLFIVATSQRVVEGLSRRTSPFIGFFQTEHLKPLNVRETTELLQSVAKLQTKADVAAFLATPRGYARTRAQHHLCGGNPRIHLVLSQFFTRDRMDTLVGPFLKMVDELTPYYLERVRELPPQQRKIVELLCGPEGTMAVKDIARRLFSTNQVISSQLLDLKEKGYVESNQRGRESLYDISDPVMRLCVEVKKCQHQRPLRLLVAFLRVWYEDADWKVRLEPVGDAPGQAGGVPSAMDDFTAVINLPDAPVELLAGALFARGMHHYEGAGQRDAAEADFKRVAALDAAPPWSRAVASILRATLSFDEGRWPDGFSSLESGLALIAKDPSSERAFVHWELTGALFAVGLSREARQEKVATVLRLYETHRLLPSLSEALVQHMGSMQTSGDAFPSVDNLEIWAAAWEKAAVGVEDFRLTLRLLRTGVDYLKAGGKDRGVLLTLTKAERRILEQAFGLEEEEQE